MTLVFLGLDDSGPRFAIDAGADDTADPESFADPRALAPLLPQGEAAILAEARSVIDWHARHRFCAQCGATSRVASAGWVRRCPECKASHYPRTDRRHHAGGARRDRIARPQPPPARRRFSCLAGFMEPGETLEEVVRRETYEEAGIRIGRVKYLASQPWPFPRP